MTRAVLHLKRIRSLAGPAEKRPVGRPWPRQHAWRELVRRIDKTLTVKPG